MSAPSLLAAMLALAAALACVRLLLHFLRTPAPQRPHVWQLALLLLAQPLLAFLLYRTLLPPALITGRDTLVVTTAGAEPRALRVGAHERLVALPEAPPLRAAEPVPDLATALRRYPATARVRIVGAGLTARDRDAAHGRRLEFVPAPLPRGLVELAVPAQATAGSDIRLHGRAEGLRGGRAELLDPAGQRVDRQPLAADGRFALLGAARGPGPTTFRLRLHDAASRVVEEVAVPVHVRAPTPPRMLVLAGGPDPELKYLRRWALDAGVQMHTQISLGGRVQIGDPPVRLDPDTLARFDLVVLDERAWNGLGAGGRRALAAAARDGLGLLLRIGGPLSAEGRRGLQALGWRVQETRSPQGFALPAAAADVEHAAARLGPGSADTPVVAADLPTRLPPLTRLPLRIVAADARTLLHDDTGTPVIAWRAAGRGRIGVWLPLDTWQLVLAGRPDLHAELWRQALTTLARARLPQAPALPHEARTGERAVLCGLADGARVRAPNGRTTRLFVDPASGQARCAGYWPQAAGWHALETGEAREPFYVRGPHEAPGLRTRELREATERLVLAAQPATTARAAPETVPGPRWPWFLAWLLLAAALWWLERARLGQRAASPAPAA